MGAYRLKAESESQLVSNQVFMKYQEKEPQLIKYLWKVQIISSRLTSFEIEHLPQNGT